MFWLVLLIIILLLGYLYQTRNHGYWEKIGVPCAGGKHWLFGHFKDVMMSTKHTGEKFREIYNEYPDSPYVGFLKTSSPCLLLRDPEYIKAVMSTDFSSFSKNEFFGLDIKNDFLFGNNPFFLYGEKWKVARGHATPLGTLSKQRTYFPNIIKVADTMIDYIKHLCLKKGSVELETKKLSGMYTTDIVANAFLGVSNNTFADPDSLFESLTKEVLTATLLENVKMMFSFLFPQFAPYFGIRLTSKRTEEILLSLARRMMKDRAENGVSRNDIFQQMLMYRKNDPNGLITDEYIASHCFSFITDGYETSSDVICFALFELAWNVDIQEKLRNEIRDFLKETNGNYGVEDVENLKYLNMVVSETLRLHPPVLSTAKVATSDYAFPSKLEIKKDCSVFIPIYALHLDPKYFPNPEKFDPERFEKGVSERHKFVYIPFGEGPRKCLGQRSALLQVNVSILKIIENFRLKPSPSTSYPVPIDPKAFIKRPLNGAWVIFEPIK